MGGQRWNSDYEDDEGTGMIDCTDDEGAGGRKQQKYREGEMEM